MKAGNLDRRIIFQSLVETGVTGGGKKSTWTNHATVWASRLPTTGNEKFEDAEVLATAQFKFLVRYRTDLKSTMRIKIGTQIYDILAILEFGRTEGLQILAKQNVTAAVT